MAENERVLNEIKREPGVAELMELYERIARVYAPASAVAAIPFEASATSDSTNRARTKKFAKAPSLTASKQSQI